MAIIEIAAHVAITVVAVIGLALRIEHRLTKIETDVSWLKATMNDNCCDKDEGSE